MNKEHQQTLYLVIAFVCKRNKDMFTLFIEQLYCILLEDSFHFFLYLKMKYLSTKSQHNHITLQVARVTMLVTPLMETQRRA